MPTWYKASRSSGQPASTPAHSSTQNRTCHAVPFLPLTAAAASVELGVSTLTLSEYTLVKDVILHPPAGIVEIGGTGFGAPSAPPPVPSACLLVLVLALLAQLMLSRTLCQPLRRTHMERASRIHSFLHLVLASAREHCKRGNVLI